MFCHIRFKACRKCRGDLSLEQDQYGTYFQCIQCGAVWNEAELRNPDTRSAQLHPVEEARIPVVHA